MFKEDRNNCKFQWKDIGNIDEGRPNLGTSTSVSIYRLMHYTLRDVLVKEFNTSKASDIFREAGRFAGFEFCKNILHVKAGFEEFISELQEKLKSFGIGILRVEKSDIKKLQFILTVEEDLSCSGLPVSEETVCDYDEGFFEGIFKAYTDKDFDVKEIDCWASGGRICRFAVNVKVNGE